MKALSIIAIAFLLTACHRADKPAQKHGQSKHLAADSNYFDKPVAVFISPSDRLIEKTKKKMGEEAFYTAADDVIWYQSESDKFLDSVHIRQVHRESEGALRFATAGGKVYTMRIDTLFFGIILFNGKSKPVQADPTNMAAEYKRYMKQGDN